jgi:hypothetical protein
MWVMWNLTSLRLEIVLVSVQDRCTVCPKHTIGAEIVLDTPDGNPRWQHWCEGSVHLEIVLIFTQDRCTVCVERTIGSKIILDAPDGTPRWCGSCEISLLSVWRLCLCRCKIGSQFAPNVPSAQKLFWTHPMVLLGNKAQVKARTVWRFSNTDATWVHGLHQT